MTRTNDLPELTGGSGSSSRLRILHPDVASVGGKEYKLSPDDLISQEMAWANALSIMLMLPGLRGLWPMSPIDSSGNAQDVSGHGHHLTYNGDPTYNVDGFAPYIDLDGTGDYLIRTDEADLDILGTESYIASGIQGLTLGGWFWRDAGSATQGLISKYIGSGNNRSYYLTLNTNDTVAFAISSDGTSGTVSSVGSAATAEGEWFCVMGRFTPSTEVAVWLNGTQSTDTDSIPASLHDGTAGLQIGAINSTGGNLLTGRASLCFLCTAALSDAIVDAIYKHTKRLFE